MLTLLVRLVMGFSNHVSSSRQMLQGCPEDSVRCFSGNYYLLHRAQVKILDVVVCALKLTVGSGDRRIPGAG